MDSVKEAIIKVVAFMREHYKENLELEVRIGQFSSDNEFVAGIQHAHLKTNYQLKSRIEKNVAQLPGWTLNEPMYTMMRCEYDGGVRRTCRNKKEDYIVKRRLKKLDLLTDRPFHFRMSVSRETAINITPAHHMYETVTKKPPLSVRYIQRISVTETIPNPTNSVLGTKDNAPFQFQWDLSKVSVSAGTKQQATKEPSVYHVEFELKTPLVPLEDKVLEASCNELLAKLITERIHSLSGTHIKKNINILNQSDTQSYTFERLPRSPLVLLASDV